MFKDKSPILQRPPVKQPRNLPEVGFSAVASKFKDMFTALEPLQIPPQNP